jgi:hypothetical protein
MIKCQKISTCQVFLKANLKKLFSTTVAKPVVKVTRSRFKNEILRLFKAESNNSTFGSIESALVFWGKYKP